MMKVFHPVTMLLYLICLQPIQAATIRYWTRNKSNHMKTGQFTRQIMKNRQGHRVVVRWKEKNGDEGSVRYSLDNRMNTLSWRFTVPARNTDYTGTRMSNRLIIRGLLNGKRIRTVLKIGSKPLINNPMLGLQHFVRSGRSSMEFTILHPYKLKTYTMKAIREEEQHIRIQGRLYTAVQVKWRLTGLLALFHSQRAYFRKGDGLFLKSKPHDNEYHTIVPE